MAGLKTILFIEDDPFIIDMYATQLRKSGFDVAEAHTGPEGLQKAQTTKFDLILLDIMMPEMLGGEVLQRLRGEDGRGLSDTKIVILTNYAQDEESRRALESQADGYLIKADITPRKLVEIIHKIDSEPN